MAGRLTCEKTWIGADLCLCVYGGEKPHVGTVILAEPHSSMHADRPSCTCSVMNIAGHRDDVLLRIIAEKACRKYRCRVVCTGGVHIDDIREDEISALLKEAEEMEI